MHKLPVATIVAFALAAVFSIAYSQAPQQRTAPAGDDPLPAVAPAQAGARETGDYQQQVSYALGRQFGMNLRQNEIPCDLRSLFAGISDVMTGAQPKYTDQQLGVTMQRFMEEMQQKGRARLERLAAKNQEEEMEFLAKNKTTEGVQVTPSGLQYKVIQAGTGPSPTLADTVRCNYRGTLVDGTEFDSSEAHGGPAEFPVGGVIKGWTEALQKMKVGDKWQLFVPNNLAYEMEPPGPPIEPGDMLIFEIELLGIL
jgi:FKBP-type peptidyl-prolyl cis-trans isomerase FklB